MDNSKKRIYMLFKDMYNMICKKVAVMQKWQ